MGGFTSPANGRPGGKDLAAHSRARSRFSSRTRLVNLMAFPSEDVASNSSAVQVPTTCELVVTISPPDKANPVPFLLSLRQTIISTDFTTPFCAGLLTPSSNH